MVNGDVTLRIVPTEIVRIEMLVIKIMGSPTQHEESKSLAFANERIHLTKFHNVLSSHRYITQSEDLFAKWLNVLGPRGQIIHEVSHCRRGSEQSGAACAHLSSDLKIDIFTLIPFNCSHDQLDQVVRGVEIGLFAVLEALLDDRREDPTR